MQRNKYDSFLIWLYNQNKEHLVPKELRKSIPHSTIFTWRNLDYTNYVGHEVSVLQKDAIDQFEIFQEHKKLKQMVFMLSKVWLQVSCIVTPFLTKFKEHQQLTMSSIEQLFEVFPKKLVFKIFSISPSTF